MTVSRSWSPDSRAVLERLRDRLFATATEVSVVLSYDKAGRTVRKAIEAGEIPAIRAGGTWRIPTSWLFEQLPGTGNSPGN